MRTDKNNNFKFTIKFLITLDIGYLGFLGTDLFKSVLMYSNGAICLIKLLFKMGLFTVWQHKPEGSLSDKSSGKQSQSGKIIRLFSHKKLIKRF